MIINNFLTMKEIKVKLPEYINNIFDYSSLCWESDYLHKVFDDRNMNLDSFEQLNFEIYKHLVIQEKYNDNSFLAVKKNLYTIFQLYRSKYMNINFTFSDYYGKVNFIEKELNVAWSDFDKFYGNLYGKRNYWFIKKFLKGRRYISWVMDEIIKMFFLENNDNIFEEFDLIDELKIKLENEYEVFSQSTHDDLYDKKYKKHIQFLTSLYNNDELTNILLFKDDDAPIYSNFCSIVVHILSNEYAIEWFNNLPEKLKKLITDLIKEDIFIHLYYILYDWNIRKIQFIQSLWIKDEIKNSLLWVDINKNDLIYENIELILDILKIEWGEDFIYSLYDNNKNLLQDSVELLIKNYWFFKLYDLYKKLFWENYFLKLDYNNDIEDFLRYKDGIEILKQNNKNDYVIETFEYHPDLLLNLVETEDWISYLRELDIEMMIIGAILEYRDEEWVPRFFNDLLDKTEWVKYFEELLQEYNFLKDIIDTLLKKPYFNFSKMSKYLASLKPEIIKLLRKEEWENFKNVFQNIYDTELGIDCIIEAHIEEKILKETLNERFFIWYNNFPIEYLKSLLHFETNHVKNQVYDFIKKSHSWSCLLSWYRWTGKTSLINTVIKKLQKENDTEITQVMINIPEQKKDENWEKKSFNKNELITKIIREIYLALVKNWYSKSEIENFEEQYIRTFKNIEDFEWFLHLKKRWFLRLAIDVLSFCLPIFSWLVLNYFLWFLNIRIFGQTFWFSFEMIQLFIAFILIILNFLVFRTIFNAHFKARLERTLYNEEIAEYKLTENIKTFHNKRSFFHGFKKIFSLSEYQKVFWKIISFLKGVFFWKKRKLVIVIDELDKLLDLDKWIGKGNMDMVDIFDLLWKLKTLFFDNTWAIFFVVTNKDAYNYYLENKHSEDDLVSNIFNKVLYLPMIAKENFNLNWSFEIEWFEEPKIESEKQYLSHNQEEENHKYISKWLYFKSHWNWRKANFILSQKLKWKQIVLSNHEIGFDMNFYNFVDLLYSLFASENTKNSKEKFDEHFIPWKLFYDFISDKIINDKDWYCKKVCEEIINSMKKIWSNYDLIASKDEDLLKKYTDNKVPRFNVYAYMHASVERISWEFAYRDYVLNNILNILEIIKHDKMIRLEDIILKLKFNEYDIKYPVFEDLILIYIPFMIYYFDNLEKWQK